MYLPSEQEIERLQRGILAAFATPFVDDLEDFVWEAIFAYMKNLPLPDTLVTKRKKLLFDVIDPSQQIGWSAKALRASINPPSEFELVIQRADIFKKSQELGFESLSVNAPVDQLGAALLQHWYGKVAGDAKTQTIQHKRVCILIKSKNLKRFALLEEELAEYTQGELEWHWTDRTRTGLQGIRKTDGFCVFRWYPNQKQLFERFILPINAPVFMLNPKRLPLAQSIDLLLDAVNRL